MLIVFLSARAYRVAPEPYQRAAALCCIAEVVVWMVQAYGDMGMTSWTATIHLAIAAVVSGKLSVAVGAWPAPRPQAVSATLAPVPALPGEQRPA
jgi:hypothetical protein